MAQCPREKVGGATAVSHFNMATGIACQLDGGQMAGKRIAADCCNVLVNVAVGIKDGGVGIGEVKGESGRRLVEKRK